MAAVATPCAWMLARLEVDAAAWVQARIDAIATTGLAESAGRRALGIAYAQIARRVPRTPLRAMPPADLRRGWDPRHWTLDQTARAALLSALPATDGDALVAAIDDLAARADVQETLALYQALPVLPLPGRWRDRASEGLRSNMRAVFDAVALDNPYPAEQLDEQRWNQLVLKACFVGAPCHRIVGLDARANADLTRMLVQYANERWAAARPIPPGLWRSVALHVDDTALAALDRALHDDDARTRAAAALALRACPHPRASALLSGPPAVDQDWPTLEGP